MSQSDATTSLPAAEAASLMRSLPADLREASIAAATNVIDGRDIFGNPEHLRTCDNWQGDAA